MSEWLPFKRREGLTYSLWPLSRTKGMKLQESKFRVNTRKNFLTVRVVLFINRIFLVGCLEQRIDGYLLIVYTDQYVAP